MTDTELDAKVEEIERLRKTGETIEALDRIVDLFPLLIAERRQMMEALKGVLRVADRKTVEFDAVRAVLPEQPSP